MTSLGIACLLLALAASLGVFQVLMRFVFQQPAEWTEVIIRFSLIWMVFLGIPEAFRVGAMVSIDLVQRVAPPLMRRVLQFIVLIATVTLLGFIIWYGWDYAQRGSVQTVAGLENVSMFWAYLALPVGSVIALVGIVCNFFEPQQRELDNAQ
ncbi:MAG TPA: TRAP transporter small permease [Noviherbaspirillum sp.]|nr:TRAP transporter small permease [Noviherbaspirillum sp.]